MSWGTNTTYVDIDTGEKIDRERAIASYTIIKKHKKTQYNATSGNGTIYITNECRINAQLNLFTEETIKGTIQR